MGPFYPGTSTPSPPGHRRTALISADVWSRPLRLRRLGSPGALHRQQGRPLHPRCAAHCRGLQYIGAEHRIGTSAPRICRASDRTPTTAMPSSPPPGGPVPSTLSLAPPETPPRQPLCAAVASLLYVPPFVTDGAPPVRPLDNLLAHPREDHPCQSPPGSTLFDLCSKFC